MSVGPLFLRLDVRPIRLGELLHTVGGRSGLLLDLKADRHNEQRARKYIRGLVAELSAHPGSRAEFCGSWRFLDLLHEFLPGARLVYSVDTPAQCEAALTRLGHGDIARISLRYGLLNEARVTMAKDAGVQFYCWDVSTPTEARRAVEQGATGIIASLEVLSALGDAVEA